MTSSHSNGKTLPGSASQAHPAWDDFMLDTARDRVVFRKGGQVVRVQSIRAYWGLEGEP